jgi:glutamate carboxypeptidase
MVAINSFTANPAGIDRVGKLIAASFAELGYTARFISPSHPEHGHHLVLRRPHKDGAPTVALISHLDTVYTEEEEQRNDFRWREEGTRIHGPGTHDIKGGNALIWLMLTVLQESDPQTFGAVNWVILFNACEEVISTDFRKLAAEELPADTRACLVFEGDGGMHDADFAMVSARKGRAVFVLDVVGRGAHAGSSHERGANAIVELAGLVSRVSQLTSYQEHLTVNVGSISGGSVANRVPHFATAELEMRAFDAAIYARAKSAIMGCAGPGVIRSANGEGHPCQVSVTIGDETRPWPRNAATDRLFAVWECAARDLGITLRNQERGGLSDGNVICDLFPTIDGLGPRGDHAHCSERSADGSKEQEWVDVSSFVPKAVLNLKAILSLVREG